MPHFPIRHKTYGSQIAQRRRGNPYFADKSVDRLGASPVKNILAKLPPKFWMFLFVLIVLFILIIWLTGWANFLQIKNIEIRGSSLIPASAIENITRERLNKKRLFFIPEAGLIIYNTKALSSDIKAIYPLDKIKIVKRLPGTLIIEITEKTPVAVWFEADNFYEIDKDGWILSTTEGDSKDMPIIYNNGLPAVDGKKIKDKEKIIDFATRLSPIIKAKLPNLEIKEIACDNEVNSLKIALAKGPLLYFSIVDSPELQMDRLSLLLHSEIKDRFEKIRYIDLRFGDRVYYQ